MVSCPSPSYFLPVSLNHLPQKMSCLEIVVLGSTFERYKDGVSQGQKLNVLNVSQGQNLLTLTSDWPRQSEDKNIKDNNNK